jgi:hypothetical protein
MNTCTLPLLDSTYSKSQIRRHGVLFYNIRGQRAKNVQDGFAANDDALARRTGRMCAMFLAHYLRARKSGNND